MVTGGLKENQIHRNKVKSPTPQKQPSKIGEGKKNYENITTSPVRTGDLLVGSQTLLQLSYGDCRQRSISTPYLKLDENNAPFWHLNFWRFNCHLAGLADLWPRLAPTRVPDPSGRPFWKALLLCTEPGGGHRRVPREAPPDARVGAAHGCGPAAQSGAADRYVFLYPPPGIEPKLPGGEVRCPTIGLEGGGLVKSQHMVRTLQVRYF